MARPKKNTNKHLLADKMRRAVLQAAIEGKLTEQHPATDGYARDLLADIESEKQWLIKAGEIKRQKLLSDITEEEQPFDIPDNWEWVRLGEVVEVNPRNQAEDNLEAAFVPMRFIEDEYKNSLTFEVKEWAKIKKGYTHFAKNDVVFAKITPCFQNLKSTIIPDIPNGIGAGTTEIHVLRNFANHIDLEYLLYFVKNPLFINNGVATFTGTAGQQRIGTDFVKEYLFPLPPLAEQQRIAATIKEVFLQIDSLHADENALYALQTAFPQQMRAALLQAAIEGKLTQQNAIKDGHTSELLANIETEKQKLIEVGELKRQKSLSPITEEEKPFDIPDNWEWVRLDQLSIYIQRGRSPKYSSIEEIPVISQKCVQWDGFSLELAKFIDPESKDKYQQERFLQDEDLLWNSTGLGTVGRVTRYKEEINKYDIAVADSHVTVVRLLKNYVLPQYVEIFISSPIIQQNIEDICSGSTKQKELATSTVKNTVLPLPPLSEQQRIVELLEQALPEIQTLKGI